MNSVRSLARKLISPRRALATASARSALIFGLVIASTCAGSLYAQAYSSSLTADASARNQIAQSDWNIVTNASLLTDTSNLPEAPVPNIPTARATASLPGSPTAPSSSEAGDPVDTRVITPATLTFDDRLRLYEHSFVTPQSLVGPLLGAGVAQAEGSPREWSGGMAGFGRRFASSYGRSVIGRTIEFGVAAADHEDPRYLPSDETGIWRRTRHAIAATFISETSGGGSMPAFSRFVGAYGSGFIANAWEPPSQNGTGPALKRGSISLLSSVGWHVFEEFWPDIRGEMQRHHN